MAIGVQTDMCSPALARFGSDALKREFLAPAIAGDMVGCIGVSEPGAGSDVASIKSHARKDGDDYVITGQKMWITNSLQADWMCMLVNTGDSATGNQHKNKSLIMVPMRDGPNGKLTKGVEVAKKIRKIGMNSSDTGLIYFDEVRVPQRNLIGQEGAGFMYQMMQFQEERLWAAASGLQSLTNCIDWRNAGGPAVGAVQTGGDENRGGKPARPDLPRLRVVCAGAGCDRAGVHGQAQSWTAEPHRA
jgi:citronellyl-CoA dehydrogenase